MKLFKRKKLTRLEVVSKPPNDENHNHVNTWYRPQGFSCSRILSKYILCKVEKWCFFHRFQLEFGSYKCLTLPVLYLFRQYVFPLYGIFFFYSSLYRCCRLTKQRLSCCKSLWINKTGG